MRRKAWAAFAAAGAILWGCASGIPDVPGEPGENAVLLEVPFIDQRMKYPTGCECVSAVMALQYLGCDVSVETFIDNYMERGELPRDTEEGRLGPDPDEVFLGNPYTGQGYGCYAGAIQLGLERYLKDNPPTKGGYESLVLKDVPVPELAATYLDNGIPVIFWVGPETEEALSPEVWTEENTGKQITWNYPEHCVLLVGYDEEYYYFNDPSGGKQTAWGKEETEARYANQFSQAVAIVPEKE